MESPVVARQESVFNDEPGGASRNTSRSSSNIDSAKFAPSSKAARLDCSPNSSPATQAPVDIGAVTDRRGVIAAGVPAVIGHVYQGHPAFALLRRRWIRE